MSAAMPNVLRFSQLSAPRQALVRLCQSTNYGCVRRLRVKDSDPVFDPLLQVLVDVKLDADEGPRLEVDLSDFVLRDEVCRLMARLDELGNGMIESIEVRAGIPRRAVIERRLTEASR